MMPEEPTGSDATPPRPSEKELFLAAWDLKDPTEREAWLKEACGEDSALLERVLDLLQVGEEEGEDEGQRSHEDALREAMIAQLS